MKLNEFFTEHNKVALAFSGGADSSYLLYTAKESGTDVQPYYIKSQFQPEFEHEDARRLAAELGVMLREISVDVLQLDEVTANPASRCYYCKKCIMGAIRKAASADGYDMIIGGTNACDNGGDRPGMRVLKEDNILSPLRMCGIAKAELRRLSHEAGLFTWDKPAYACLATRVPTGEIITAEKLAAVEQSESYLFSLGFTDFRVCLRDGGALLQFTEKQQPRAQAEFEAINAELSKYFAEDFVPLPVLRVEYVAYGTGKKNFETANVVRVLLGETEGECEQIIELACNLDDMTPEELGFAMEELFRLGALDVYFTSIGMKKSRSGVMLTCMCRVQQRDDMLRCLFKHTTTLGVREYVCNRYSLTRSIDTVQTEYGAVRIKKAEGYGIKRSKPEYDDLAKLARENDTTIAEIRKATEL